MPPESPRDQARLSPKERDMVDYVRLGYTNAEIASALGISPNTVRNRLARVFQKMNVSRRAELAGLRRSRGR